MNDQPFVSTTSTPSQSRRSSAKYHSEPRRTKPSFSQRMRTFFSCGLRQKRSPSPPTPTVKPKPKSSPKCDVQRHLAGAQFNFCQSSKSNTGDFLVEKCSNLITKMAADGNDPAAWYTAECGTSQYTLPQRYQDLSPIGQGAFGAVIRALDTVTGKSVAIKKMLRPFQSETHAKRTYRELKLLMHLNHRDAQVVQLYNVFTPERDVNEFQTLYFVLNFVDYDLSKVIKRGKPFTEDHIKLLIYSLLRGLKFIHSAGVIHRDLKPTNIGISQNSDLTILDFGLARVATSGLQTGYVATRWWRAPEVFINWERYDEKVDIWSVGCIMAELIILKPLFAGTDHIDQLTKIFDVVGTPDLATLDEVCEPYARDYILKLATKQKQDYKKLFGYKFEPGSRTPVSGISPQGIALLDRLLSFDHRTRPTAEEALSDPYFEHLHDPMEEPSAATLLDEHQDATYTTQKWKSVIWKMMEEFEAPPWATEDNDEDN